MNRTLPPTPCRACEAAFAVAIEDKASGPYGAWCSHTGATVIVRWEGGRAATSFLAGPLTSEEARQFMAGFQAQGLGGGAGDTTH